MCMYCTLIHIIKKGLKYPLVFLEVQVRLSEAEDLSLGKRVRAECAV